MRAWHRRCWATSAPLTASYWPSTIPVAASSPAVVGSFLLSAPMRPPVADRQGRLRLRLQVAAGRQRPHRSDRVPVQDRQLELPQFHLRVAGGRRRQDSVQRIRDHQRCRHLGIPAHGHRRAGRRRRRDRSVPHQDLGHELRAHRVRQPDGQGRRRQRRYRTRRQHHRPQAMSSTAPRRSLRRQREEL